VLIGLAVGLIGIDPIGGFPRLTFGLPELSGGFNFVAVMIGLFSLSEAFRQIEQMGTLPPVPPAVRNVLPRLGEILGMWKVYLRSCIYGLIVGVAPVSAPRPQAFSPMLKRSVIRRIRRALERAHQRAWRPLKRQRTAARAVIFYLC
jgi:putative tricarboxylic transport membrane protein